MRKRILAFTLVIFLLCFNVSTAELQAQVPIRQDAITDILVATGIVISSETALAYALGVLGFTAASVAIYDNRDSLIAFCNDVKKDFIDFCANSQEWASVTSAKIEYWLEGIGTGVLDKADDVYGALKDFLTEEYKTQQTSSSSDIVPVNISNVAQYVLANKQYLLDNVKYIKVPFSDIEDVALSQHTISTVDARWSGMHEDTETHENVNNTLKISDNTALAFIYFNDDTIINPEILEFSTNTIDDDFSTDDYYYYPFSYLYGNGKSYGSGSYNPITIDSSKQYLNFLNFVGCFRSVSSVEVDLSFLTNAKNHRVYNFDTTNSELNSITGNAWKTRCILSYIVSCIYHGITLDGLGIDDGLSEEETQSYVVDGSVSDVIERDGTLDNVDVVNPSDVKSDSVPVDVEGITMQDIAQPFPDDTVKTIDTSTDTVLPDNTPVDELPNDKDVSGFTIANLQKVFPFCIPWDLYKLYSTLVSDAEAPKFVWKFPIVKSDGKLSYKELEIDLKDFDGVAKIVRTMELLAFMIFLTIKTRDLIRG